MITENERTGSFYGGVVKSGGKPAGQRAGEGGRDFISSRGLKVRVNYTGNITADEAFLEYLTKSGISCTSPRLSLKRDDAKDCKIKDLVY